MRHALTGILIAFAVPSSAVVIAPPRLAPSLGGHGAAPAISATVTAPSGNLPLGAPAALALTPTLSAPSVKSERPRLMLPTAVPILPDYPDLTAVVAAVKAAAPAARNAEKPDLDKSVRDAAALFDGGRAGVPGAGWTLGAFEGDGGAPVLYKSREGSGTAPARVYAGGLALNESFEPFFARSQSRDGSELFLWTRGHIPSAWLATKSPIDADARDLASAISLAAKNSPGGKVELALHSFATLVFQRLIQLHAEPAVAAALKALSGSRVFLLHATTHFEGSEKRAGREFEQMGQATRAVVDWLNAGDTAAEVWQAAARLNPFLIPAASAWAAQWSFQRSQLIALAAKDAGAMMRADLKEPWDKAIDHLRKAFLNDLATDTKNEGWQEAMLRRSSDMFRLEFSSEDAARIKALEEDLGAFPVEELVAVGHDPARQDRTHARAHRDRRPLLAA